MKSLDYYSMVGPSMSRGSKEEIILDVEQALHVREVLLCCEKHPRVQYENEASQTPRWRKMSNRQQFITSL